MEEFFYDVEVFGQEENGHNIIYQISDSRDRQMTKQNTVDD